MKVLLLRHGCTAGNLQRRYVGRTDEPLTEAAVKELEQGCNLYKMSSYPYSRELLKAELVFCSPLLRCRQTAGVLYPERQVILDEGLRECEFGEFEYKNYRELDGNAVYQAWIDSGGMTAFPGGESRGEFSDRCCRAFLRCCALARSRDCSLAAFVVHGGTIMAVMERYARPKRPYFDWQVKNAEGFYGEWTERSEIINYAAVRMNSSIIQGEK